MTYQPSFTAFAAERNLSLSQPPEDVIAVLQARILELEDLSRHFSSRADQWREKALRQSQENSQPVTTEVTSPV